MSHLRHDGRVPINARGVRIAWHQVPLVVQRAVERMLGGSVTAAATQPGGFSPGTAARVTTEHGRRAFVKAVSSAQNPRTPDLHRAEAHVVECLPANPVVPKLIGLFDDGDWVAALYDDVEGHTPTAPWQPTDIDAAMTALYSLAEIFTPNPVPGLQPLHTSSAPVFAGWERVAAHPPSDLDRLQRTQLDDLIQLAAVGLQSLPGSSLVHGDIRADNLIRRLDGTVAVVDWPWACVGAPWFDRLLLCINIDLYGGHDPEHLTPQYLSDVDPDQITAVLAGLCGYFVDIARRPPDLGLPTVRAFQQAQAHSTWRWLQRRQPQQLS